MSKEEIVEALIRQLVKECGQPPAPFMATVAAHMFTGLANDIVASGAKYLIVADGNAIMCLDCGAVSYNANDIAQRYCGACHAFHEAPRPPEAV